MKMYTHQKETTPTYRIITEETCLGRYIQIRCKNCGNWNGDFFGLERFIAVDCVQCTWLKCGIKQRTVVEILE